MNRKILLPVFIALLSFSNSFAQSGWQLIAPYPTNQSLYSTSFIGPNTGWIAGAKNTLLSTTDGGASWTKQSVLPGTDLYKIQFLNATKGWALSGNAVVSATNDGGATWTQQTTPVSFNSYVSTMQFTDASHGFVLMTDDSLLYTTNGGNNWSRIKIDTTESHHDMFFVSATEGWICGDDAQILHTTNGGLSWSVQPNAITTSLHLNSIFFTDAMHGWAAGYGSIDRGVVLRTINGGATWTTALQNYNDEFQKIIFRDALNGRMLSSSGVIYTTTNGGTTWSVSYTSTGEGLNDIAIVGVNEYVCGDNGAILKSTNTGASYLPIYKTATHGDNIGGISFPDALHGWVYDSYASTLKHTSDSGDTWTDQTPFTTNFQMAAMQFVDSSRGWLVGKFTGSSSFGQILRTTNGGATFSFQLNTGVAPVISVNFSDSLHGLAGTNTKLIYHTANGGANWDTASIPATGANLQARTVQLVDATTGYAIASNTYNTVLAKTTNGGTSWSVIRKDTTQFTSAFTAIYFVDAQHGYIATVKSGAPYSTSALMATSDGGITWTNITLPAPQSNNTVNKMYFSDAMHGWVAGGGFNSFILYTGNGGATWTAQEYGTAVAWYDMSFVNATRGYAAGWQGNIGKTLNGGIGNVSVGVKGPVTAASRMTVYPNPSNGSFTLRYENVSVGGAAQLIILNETGQQVMSRGIALQAGVNNMSIDASGLANGVYFIVLRNAERWEVQRLIVAH